MTSLATLRTNLGYHLGTTISTTSRWTTTQANALLNSALKKVVSKLFAARCWELLAMLEEEAEYTLTGDDSYSVYTVIGDSTDYQGFIGGRVGLYRLRVATIEEEHRTQLLGEYEPSAVNPWIIFFDYDSTEGHGNLPVFRIRPKSLTNTLYFRYLKNAPTMSDTIDSCLPTVCDDAIIFHAAAMCWSGDRNTQEFARFWQLYLTELQDLRTQYEQPIFFDVRNLPVT